MELSFQEMENETWGPFDVNVRSRKNEMKSLEHLPESLSTEREKGTSIKAGP